MKRGMVLFAAVAGAALGVYGESRLWTEATSGEPGEEVSMRLYATNDVDITRIEVAVQFDTAALTFVGVDFSTSALANRNGDLGHLDYSVRGGLVIRGILTFFDPQAALPPTENWEFARLRFRVRSNAAPGTYAAGAVNSIEERPVNSLPDTWETCMLYGESQCSWATITPGTVTVRASTRPIPPDFLQCRQDLEAVQLTWGNWIAYDRVFILRDGATHATLSGDAETFTDPNPPLGTREYAVVGTVGAKATWAVTCTVDVGAPKVEAPLNAACESGEAGVALSWELSRADYTAIAITRNGAPLAVLSGDTVAYTDAGPPAGTVYYDVIAYVDRWASPSCPCVVNGKFVLRLGSVRVAPGSAVAEVPVFLTSPRNWQAFSLGIALNSPETLGVQVTGASTEGTVLEPYEPVFLTAQMGNGTSPRGGMIAAGLFNAAGLRESPPTMETCVLKIRCALDAYAPGTVIPLRMSDKIRRPPGPGTSIVIVVSGRANFAEHIDGEIVIGEAALPEVKDLKVQNAKGDGVLLSWRNGAAYDAVEVERNGVVIGTSDGNARSLTDTLDGAGAYWYRVRGRAGDAVSPWSMVIHTYLPGVALFRRGDVNGDGVLNVADAIAACGLLFKDQPIGCLDAMDANDDGRLNLTDPVYVFAYLFAGGLPPPTPGPNVRWFDPTADDLDCATGSP